MKKTKFRIILILFVLANLIATTQKLGFASQLSQDLFPVESIQKIESLVLQSRGDQADVYFPSVFAEEDAFQVVAVLQGALLDKSYYSNFATELARFGFVVVVPNHFQVLGPPETTPPALFTDQHVVNDVLAQMILEDTKPDSPLFGIVDTEHLGLAGHSFGGAAGLFAIEGSCNPPFCFGFYQRPKALRVGAFYGTNTFDAFSGTFIDVNTGAIPVALVQGTVDGIATLEEAEATSDLLDGIGKLIPIDGANHQGILNTNNPIAIPPSFIPPDIDVNAPMISQWQSIMEITYASGQFMSKHLKGDFIPGEFPVFSSSEIEVDGDDGYIYVNQNMVGNDEIEGSSAIDSHGILQSSELVLPDLVPSVFPQNLSDTEIIVTTQNQLLESDEAVFYKKIEIGENQSASFMACGPVHIDKLIIKKHATLDFSAGTYFINELEIKDEGARITISSEPVKLHIGKKFNADGKAEEQVVINDQGNVTGLAVYLHYDSEFEAKYANLTGFIYGPRGDEVDIENTTLRGAIITGGEVELEKGIDIVYTDEDKDAVSSMIITQ